MDEQEPDPARRYKPFPDRPYLGPLLDVLEYEPVIFIEKSRTMLGTWTCAAYIAHRIFTEQGCCALAQSEDEARALKVVSYVKVLWDQSDDALRSRWKPKDGRAPGQQAENNFIMAHDSKVLGLVGNPDKIRSEHPTIYMMDEAAIMTQGESALNQAAATRCPKIICLSSAYPGWFRERTRSAVPVDWPDYKALGAAAIAAPPDLVPDLTPEQESEGWFRTKKEIKVKIPCPGLSMRRTEEGFAVVRLHYSADPEITPEVQKKLRKKYTNGAEWNLEMEINYEAKDGQLVFSEFSPEVHVIPHEKIPSKLCRYMAIDPHPRTPHAHLWVGLDRTEIYVYRELWPSQVYGQNRMLKNADDDNSYTVREYAELIAEWEGNRLDMRHIGTEEEYASYIRDKENGEYILDRYMDQAGKGFLATGEDEQPESYADRYNRYAIECRDPFKRREPGFEKIRELMRPRPYKEGQIWPRLHISSRCTELILELQKLRYLKDRRQSDERELKQGAVPVRTHLIDLLRYLVTADLWYSDASASYLSKNDSKFRGEGKLPVY